MAKEITSNKNKEVVHFYNLNNDKKYRHLSKEFIVEGFKQINEVIDINPNLIKAIIVLDKLYDKNFKEIFRYTLFNHIQIYKVTDSIIKKLSTNNEPPEILGVVSMLDTKIDNNKNVILLDNIQDPGNLGTILRSAVAFGFNNIIFNNCVDLYNHKTIKAAMGAIFKINFLAFKNEHSSLEWLNKNQYFKIATKLDDDAKLINDINQTKKYCILIGNEGHGLSNVFIENCDLKIQIPIINTESLNVAVATSIILYELNKK